CLRQSSSSELSCITTKAGTPCCFATARRHSRRYSRSSASTLGSAALVMGKTGATGCDRGVALIDFTSHSDSHPQASQAPHVSHFGFSPKCKQICRCRQPFESAKPRMEWYRCQARSFSDGSTI